MNQKYKSIIAIILAVWIFALGFAVGKDAGSEASLTSGTQQTTEASVGEKPNKPDFGGNNAGTNNGGTNAGTNNGGTNNGGTNNGNTNNGGTTDNGTNNPPAPTDPSQYSDEQIVQMMNYYVNLVKAESNMSATKSETIKVTVTDCSVPSLVGAINDIVSGIIGGESETFNYTFANNYVTSTNDPEASTSNTPFSLIPPTNKEFKVSMDGIADASASVDANGNVTYTVVLVPENTTLSSPEPFYNATAIGYLNLASLDISPAKISQADMHYPGSTVSVTVDSNDKVIKLYNKLPMTGDGKASLGLSGEASFEGALDETWEFTY